MPERRVEHNDEHDRATAVFDELYVTAAPQQPRNFGWRLFWSVCCKSTVRCCRSREWM